MQTDLCSEYELAGLDADSVSKETNEYEQDAVFFREALKEGRTLSSSEYDICLEMTKKQQVWKEMCVCFKFI